MADLQLKNITKYFGDNRVLNGLNLDVKSGEFVTLLGPSGCGKTTLLRMIAGLETVEEGEIHIGGKKFNNIPAQQRSIAMVFQSYALFPHMNVKNNIIFGLKIKKMPEYEMFEKLQWVLPLLGLEGLEERLPRQISGGQRQRVALARALVLDPEVLLLDEPLSNLDTALREMAMEELKRIHRKVGKTIIYVTHNQVEAMSMSERIAVMNNGGLEQYASPHMTYNHPDTVFSAEFIGSPAANIFKGTLNFDSNKSVGMIDSEIGVIKLDQDRSVNAKEMGERSVVIAVRPQDIRYTLENEARRNSDTIVTIQVELIETMGDRSIVIGKTKKGKVIRFLVTHDENITIDDEISVIIDGRKLHLFDPQSEKNIFHH